MGLSPTNTYGYVCKSTATLTTARSAGVTPEVHLRISIGREVSKQEIHPGFETGISGQSKRTCVLQGVYALCGYFPAD